MIDAAMQEEARAGCADVAPDGLLQEPREDVLEAHAHRLGETELLDAASRSENKLFMALPSDRLLEAERRKDRSQDKRRADEVFEL
jgi:hypothetical protein